MTKIREFDDFAVEYPDRETPSEAYMRGYEEGLDERSNRVILAFSMGGVFMFFVMILAKYVVDYQ